MSNSDARYYRRREAKELKAATQASDPKLGRLHWQLAQHYADLADRAEQVPSKGTGSPAAN